VTGQSQRLFRVLRDADVPAKIHAAEGKNHKTINDDLGTPGDKPSQALFEFVGAVSKSAQAPHQALEPWASMAQSQHVPRRHSEDMTAVRQAYRIEQGGTMDGTN